MKTQTYHIGEPNKRIGRGRDVVGERMGRGNIRRGPSGGHVCQDGASARGNQLDHAPLATVWNSSQRLPKT